MSFDSLGLSAALLRAVKEQGYSDPTPIQARVIPVVLEARDVMAGAQTGTGKTAGFTLPMLQRLSTTPQPQGKRAVRALILAPTRELAAQIAESVKNYGRHLQLTSAAIFGGVSINPQITALRRGVDILIATPGRLLDLAEQRHVDLAHVEIFVLDEADRMLDMGFMPDIRRVIRLLPTQRQSLLFSATFPPDIRKLAHSLLHSPVEVEAAKPNAAGERIEQLVHLVDRREKRGVLSWLIGDGNWRQVLVFTRTKHGANRLSEQLAQDGLSSAAIHGNKSQGARTRALSGFKDGSVRVLVATDIAARGIDIDQLPHVVNFDLPEVPEHYVHRIGRTGRAGREGVAISLVGREEQPLLKAIERLLGYPIPHGPLTGYAPRPMTSEPSPSHDRDRPQGHGRRHGQEAPTGNADNGHAHGQRKRRPGAAAGHKPGGGRRGNRHRGRSNAGRAARP